MTSRFEINGGLFRTTAIDNRDPLVVKLTQAQGQVFEQNIRQELEAQGVPLDQLTTDALDGFIENVVDDCFSSFSFQDFTKCPVCGQVDCHCPGKGDQ